MKRASILAVVSVSAACSLLAARPGLAEAVKGAGLFPIVQAGKYGYIDRAGTVVIAPRFDQAIDFMAGSGLAGVRFGDAWGAIDVKGVDSLVLEVEFGELFDVNDRADWGDPILVRK